MIDRQTETERQTDRKKERERRLEIAYRVGQIGSRVAGVKE